jgi:hypothetical protein
MQRLVGKDAITFRVGDTSNTRFNRVKVAVKLERFGADFRLRTPAELTI